MTPTTGSKEIKAPQSGSIRLILATILFNLVFNLFDFDAGWPALHISDL